MKRLAVVGQLLFLLAVLGSCASSEQSILITARAAGTGPTLIHNVQFQVLQTMGSAPAVGSADTNVVDRTIQDINGDRPILIAVHLHEPTPVMIHIIATTMAGTRLYATRCYEPAGVLRDEVLLVPSDTTADVDGDGWPSPAHVDSTCRDPGPGATGVACDVGLCTALEGGDCNDMATATPMLDCSVLANRTMSPCIYPGAGSVCGDGIDQDCRSNGLPGGSLDEPCVDGDGDGYTLCGPAGGVCDCVDTNADIHPGAVDVCGNGIDEDCSGEPGGMGAFCDHDGDGYPGGPMQPDCNDDDPMIHPGGLELEHCDSSPVGGMCGIACQLVAGRCACDGIDNNCNHLVDEDASCQSPDLDGDGSDACATGVHTCGTCDCNDCDSGIHPGATDYCGDTIDEDGIGGDMACAAGDTDRDGYTGGQDCMEGDPRVHLAAPENCNTGPSESCNSMSCPPSLDLDGDGFAATSVSGTDCNDSMMDGMPVNPWATEVCNGIDDNCNGDADEVLDPANATGCVTDPTCTTGPRCVVTFATSIHHCGECRHECNPGTTLVANQCLAGACSCTTNPGGAACAVGSTCCDMDAMGHPVAHPGCDDTDTSINNCGGCGNACDPRTSDVCVGGRCECGATGAACTGTQTCCGGQCVETGTDTANCGACFHACGARTACTSGICGCDDPIAHGDCNPADIGMPSGNGCETDLLTDANFCGTCAQSCLDENVATGTCSGGTCSIGTCDPLFGDCTSGASNGCETPLSTTANCGGCGTSCAPMHADAMCIVSGGTSASCGYGMCIGTFGNCDTNVVNGCETNLRAVSTCNACGTDCNTLVHNATPTCTAAGACDYTGSCAAGTSDCTGGRADGCEPFATTHCGSACTNCSMTVANASGAICGASGTCDYTGACAAGTSDCTGGRADGCEAWTNLHCGATCTNCTTAETGVAMATCNGSGFCDYTACNAGRADCNGSRADGCEMPADGTHCGATCVDCSGMTTHVNALMCTGGGTCDYTTCATGFAECNGMRADGCERAWDGTHCGASCVNCTAMTQHVTMLACPSGTCDYAMGCAANFFDCDTNRANGCEQPQDAMHCGGCTSCAGVIQHASLVCTGGTCDYGACSAGWVDCDGNRGNGCETAQDGAHCGTMCTDCTMLTNVATATCGSGTCAITTCSGAHANCDGMTGNGCESSATMDNNCCGVNCTGMTGMTNCVAGPAGHPMCGP